MAERIMGIGTPSFAETSFILWLREGDAAVRLWKGVEIDNMASGAILASHIEKHSPDRIFILDGRSSEAIAHVLSDYYGIETEWVSFGANALVPEVYPSRGLELTCHLHTWSRIRNYRNNEPVMFSGILDERALAVTFADEGRGSFFRSWRLWKKLRRRYRFLVQCSRECCNL